MHPVHLLFLMGVFAAGWVTRHKFGSWPLSDSVAGGPWLDAEETEILNLFRESRQAEEKAAAEKRKAEFRAKVVGKIQPPPT